jgi:hypothetical protein
MRCLKKNKQKLYYALLIGEEPIYKLDDHGNKIVDWTDTETGEVHYVETGESRLIYSAPVSFMGNIAMSGSDVDRVEYGVSEAKYEAVLAMTKGEIPITETSLLWYQTTPTTYTEDEKTYADDSTADYRVLKVSPSINEDRYILDKVVK